MTERPAQNADKRGTRLLSEPEFGELPSSDRGRRKWEPIVEKLIANPGQWARIAYGHGGADIGNLHKWFPGIETVTHRQRAGKNRELWARWPPSGADVLRGGEEG